MSALAIQVKNLSKRYRIGVHERYGTLRESLMTALKSPFLQLRRIGKPIPEEETIWALQDVSLEVKEGEALGIIGRNGAGKTTLLKILSRITDPTKGRVVLKGRVASLLEVGTGFHPELTGKENIYLNGAILGMNRNEINRRFDEIVAFAEIEKFLDTPVKRYSSGMYMRLAFAVAAHLDPEILLVDEVLAVGDIAFQKKCLGRMGEVANEGRTVLFVSHNMAAVEKLCQRGLVLDKGEIRYIGSQSEAITEYLKDIAGNRVSLVKRHDRIGSGDVKVLGIEVRDERGNRLDTVMSGQDVDIYLYFETSPRLMNKSVIVSLKFKTQLDIPVFLHHNRLTLDEFRNLPRSGAFVCSLKRLPLPPSTYRITYSIIAGGEYLDGITDAVELNVVTGDFFGSGEVPPISHGICLVEGHWRLISETYPIAERTET